MSDLLCSREKYWKEADIDLKVERCREQIKSLRALVNRQHKMIQQLSNHSHLDGDIVIPMEEPEEERWRRESDEVTF
jgi:archaellum component FlaC